MSKPRWENWLRRFAERKERRTLSDTWGWIGILLVTLPGLLSEPFTLQLGPLGPEAWRAVYGALTIWSVAMIGTIVTTAFVTYCRDDLNWKWLRRIWKRERDWVPGNCAELAETIVREIEQEERGATGSS